MYIPQNLTLEFLYKHAVDDFKCHIILNVNLFHSVVSKHFALQTPNTLCYRHVAFPYISLDIHRIENTVK
jgi:hypothetical protein